MQRKEFTNLLQRYLSNECTAAEKALVEYWYSLLETPDVEQSVDLVEIEARLWERVKPKTTPSPAVSVPSTVPLVRWYYRLGIAASILLLCAVGWGLYPTLQQMDGPLQTRTESGTRGWVEQVNATKAPQQIILSDGSHVTLEPGSRLYYAASFAGNKREVELIGKAFFQVERMPAKPFYVYTGKVVTQVLGTSFRVSTQGAGDQVDVEVVTGRVSVYERLGKAQARVNNGVILAPNHKATYFAQNQHFITGLVDAPALLATESAKDTVARFVYDDTPIRDVVKQLETAYGINIALEDNQLSECPITADISNKPLYSQLDIICAALQATYAVQGTTILISGKGCQK